MRNLHKTIVSGLIYMFFIRQAPQVVVCAIGVLSYEKRGIAAIAVFPPSSVPTIERLIDGGQAP